MIEEISPDGHRTAGQVTHYLRYAAAANGFVGSHGRVSPSSQTCGMSISSHNPVHRPTLGKTETENTSGTKSEGAAQKAVFLASLQGEFTSGNAAFSQLLGYSAKELEGRKLSALFTPTEKNIREGGADFQKALLNAGAGQEDYQAQLFVRSKSGESILVEVSATLVRDSQATPVAIVGIVTPVAEATAETGKSVAAAAVALGPGITSRTIDDTQFILASPVMHKFMGLVERVAGHTETVLVTGETGTGKELIARTVHESSNRRSRPWVDINCAALPENLVESELFGYEKGAFSGADSSKPGLFELADKSTIFLDEIGELQPQIQVKLLRVLDGAPYYRLGGNRKITVDVRVVAATNQDLELAVKEGRFREDLFHRLSQFQLRVPPLRERPEDIAALAQYFLSLKAEKVFTPDALTALQSHPWPGNIRELRNLIAKLAMAIDAQ